MRYRIIAVGKLRRGFYREGCQRYLELLSGLAKVELIETREPAHGAGERGGPRLAAELLAAADGHKVALDERGISLSTRLLALRVSALEQLGASRISLLIGGPDGHHDGLLSAVDESWSLSPLTFSHELARLVLLEQLYRGEALRAGHPYHRD